jgi:hypothetical protein
VRRIGGRTVLDDRLVFRSGSAGRGFDFVIGEHWINLKVSTAPGGEPDDRVVERLIQTVRADPQGAAVQRSDTGGAAK